VVFAQAIQNGIAVCTTRSERVQLRAWYANLSEDGLGGRVAHSARPRSVAQRRARDYHAHVRPRLRKVGEELKQARDAKSLARSAPHGYHGQAHDALRTERVQRFSKSAASTLVRARQGAALHDLH
jgi:hypothetical protein